MNKTSNKDFFSLVELEIATKDISFTVVGSSMEPFFKDGKTLVTITKVKSLKKYDVVLFKLNNAYILHRIIKIKNSKITTEGDNLLSKEVIDREDIIAKVVSYKNERLINSSNLFYKLKVRLWYFLKSIKKLIKRFIQTNK